MAFSWKWIKRPKKKASGSKRKGVNKPTQKSSYGRRGAVVPMFEDKPTLKDSRAYQMIYEQDTVLSPVRKKARKCGAFTPKIVGGGDRGRELNKALHASPGLSLIQEWMGQHGEIEGVAFAYLRAMPKGKMNVIDFRDSGGRKLKAGGNFWWDGYEGDDAVWFSPIGGWMNEDEALRLDRSRLVVFKPSADVNPEGDTRLAQCLLDIAWLTALLQKAEQVYTERFSLPKEVLSEVLDGMNPEDVNAAFTNSLGELEETHAMNNLALDARSKLELIEAKGKTWEFLKELRIALNSRAHKLMTGEDLSSSAQGSGDTGSSDLADKQLFHSAHYLMQLMEDEWTLRVIPFLEEINSHWLPEEDEDAAPMRIEFIPPIEKQRISVAETVSIIGTGYPLKYGFIDRAIGHESGRDPDEFFVSETAKPTMPSSTGQSEQRPDRAAPDSNMPEPESNPDDLRNVDNEEE